MIDTLILTPDVLLGEIIRYRIELIGFTSFFLQDSGAFEEAVTSRKPRVILIDLDLLDGFTIIEKLSGDESTTRIPIIALSATGDLIFAERAYLAGVRSFLLTPFDPQQLEEKVIQAFDRSLTAPETEMEPLIPFTEVAAQ